MSELSVLNEPWYKEGLRFGCTQCGKCCTGSPGYVWVEGEDIAKMAKFLNITQEEFHRKYLRKVFFKYSLKEDPKTYDCVFLKDNKCQVYGARPTKCKTFPFWPEYLSSEEAWQEAKDRCEGINDEAPLISLEQITQQMNET